MSLLVLKVVQKKVAIPTPPRTFRRMTEVLILASHWRLGTVDFLLRSSMHLLGRKTPDNESAPIMMTTMVDSRT